MHTERRKCRLYLDELGFLESGRRRGCLTGKLYIPGGEVRQLRKYLERYSRGMFFVGVTSVLKCSVTVSYWRTRKKQAKEERHCGPYWE